MNDIQIQNLKQPLTPIIGRAQIALNELAKDEPDLAVVRYALQVIHAQGKREKAMLEVLAVDALIEELEAAVPVAAYPEQEEQMVRPEEAQAKGECYASND